MIEIETLIIYLTAVVSTLLGFTGIVFIFWVNIKTKEGHSARIDKTRETAFIVKCFPWLIYSAIVFIVICVFGILWFTVLSEFYFENILMTGVVLFFLVWTIGMALFFGSIYSEFVEKLKT